MPRSGLPTGSVTFLFTDVEGSTRLLDALGERAYAEALADHRRVVRESCRQNDGVEVDTQGDAFFFAFGDAARALAAAREIVTELGEGPILVRAGLHTGTPFATDEGYVGMDVHRAARIAAAAHGGQVLVSSATAAAAGREQDLRDLGEHRFKDLSAPERIYQLGDYEFPPPKTLSASNLPVPTTPFVGRERELNDLASLLTDPEARVVTVVGPGGVGKTRLAIAAAGEASHAFPDGVWWIALAPLGDARDAAAALAQTLGVREQEGVALRDALRTRLEGRRTLVLLDNAEHLLSPIAEFATELVSASARLVVLATSRERLQLTAERVFAVPPLTASDAVELFRDRASAVGVDVGAAGAVEELVERLDRLPLAIQLAAARLRTFSPAQLLERLGERFALLKGARDLEPRQQTIRATLEWSHDLLTAEEQRLFRRLAVFVGGCTLAAAEAVSGAEADALEALVDKSLLQRRDGPEPRFWMLESIHAYASERLDEAGETQLPARHAAYFRSVAEEAASRLDAGEPEEGPVAALAAEIGNLRAAVDYGFETGDSDLVRAITASLPMYWIVHGLYGEARAWLERALALSDEEDATRRRLLGALGVVAYAQGDHRIATEASDEAAELAMRLGGVTDRFEALEQQAIAALHAGDLPKAEALFREALDVAIAVDNGVGVSSCRLGLVTLANRTSRHDLAESLLHENLPYVRSKGQARCEAYTLTRMSQTTAAYRDRPEFAADTAASAARRALQIGDRPLVAACLDVLAAAAAARGDASTAAVLLASVDAARQSMGVASNPADPVRAKALERLGEPPDAEPLELEDALEFATGTPQRDG